MIEPRRAFRDVQPRIVRHHILQVSASRADLQNLGFLQIELLHKLPQRLNIGWKARRRSVHIIQARGCLHLRVNRVIKFLAKLPGSGFRISVKRKLHQDQRDPSGNGRKYQQSELLKASTLAHLRHWDLLSE